MKKIVYILLLAFSSAFTFTACTEETVTPSNVSGGAGGNSSPDPL